VKLKDGIVGFVTQTKKQFFEPYLTSNQIRTQYSGKEDTLMSELVNKYGPELEDVVSSGFGRM
jgi:hypothetical protein